MLLSKDYEVAKICDVGLSHIMGNTSLSPEPAKATFAYAAPEVLMNERYALLLALIACVTNYQAV